MNISDALFERWYGMSKYTQVIYDNPQNRRKCKDGFEAGYKAGLAEAKFNLESANNLLEEAHNEV